MDTDIQVYSNLSPVWFINWGFLHKITSQPNTCPPSLLIHPAPYNCELLVLQHLELIQIGLPVCSDVSLCCGIYRRRRSSIRVIIQTASKFTKKLQIYANSLEDLSDLRRQLTVMLHTMPTLSNTWTWLSSTPCNTWASQRCAVF